MAPDTAMPSAVKAGRPTSVFDLYLSPGDFVDVKPSVYCDEDFFPLRSRPHNYNSEIAASWRKTPTGFSGDVVVPASFFERKNFSIGQEIGLSLGAQKTFPPKDMFEDDLEQIILSSKEDKLFPVESPSPATFQRMILLQSASLHTQLRQKPPDDAYPVLFVGLTVLTCCTRPQ